MRRLMPVALEGSESHEVEALPSYIIRLAADHGVTVGGLFRHILNNHPEEHAMVASMAAQPLAAGVRPNATTQQVVNVLARSGCVPEALLRQATFLHLSPALARSPAGYAQRLRWCPACLCEQEIATGIPYLKLSWFFSSVRTCEAHRIVLRDTCPHCRQHPPTGRWWPTFRDCPRCEHRLATMHASDRIELDSEGYAPDLVGLVGDIARRRGPYPACAVNRYVDQVFDEAWAFEQEVKLWEMLPRDECLRYAMPDEPITLATARRIAFHLEVPLVEILSGTKPVIRSFGFAVASSLPNTMATGSPRRKVGRAALTQRLKAHLEASHQAESLREVARHLGVSVGAIRYHCPEVAESVVRRRKAFLDAASADKRYRAKELVTAAIQSWAPDDGPLNKKALLRRLFPKVGVPKNLLRAEILTQLATGSV